jgi:indole-3-glycerol phosphate synthase
MTIFRDALASPGIAAIAEVKRRSPSAGDLRPAARPAELVRDFERSGAAAVSILVDERFGGSIEDLRTSRPTTGLPLLAKGFFRETSEIDALREAGADAVLLLLRDLDDRSAARLQQHARSLGMDALVEAHDDRELERAVRLGAEPIGINARDLATFAIDLERQLELVERAPRDRTVVAESGISHRGHVISAELAGADAILIGSALMRAADPGAMLRHLIARPVTKACGLTREEDVAAAADAGIDLAGFVLAESPRRVARPLPVPDPMLSVAVVVGSQGGPLEADLVQRYDEEDGHRSREARLVRGDRTVARVLDLPVGRDDRGHLSRAARVARTQRVMLAGGLRPDTVGQAIETVRPWSVDAARGLESSPGIKDPEAMRAFVASARRAAS